MCRGLGLLHEGALTSDISEGNGSDVRSPAVSPTLGSQSRKHHRLVGGMDILQHSNPHLSDVLQVRLCHTC